MDICFGSEKKQEFMPEIFFRLCAWCKKISTPDMYSATFLFGTLRVQMKYDAEQEGSPMTDLEVISQLAGKPF